MFQHQRSVFACLQFAQDAGLVDLDVVTLEVYEGQVSLVGQDFGDLLVVDKIIVQQNLTEFLTGASLFLQRVRQLFGRQPAFCQKGFAQ